MYAPRYLCREHETISLIKEFIPKNKKVLEIGFGTGDLIIKLNELGYKGLAIDASKKTTQKLKEKLKKKSFGFEIKNKFDTQIKSKFDLVLAFEVLEHIKEDKKRLKFWNSFLNENGFLLLSVPAHQSEWGYNDEYGGHFRRYERKELEQKLVEASFKIERFYCYGFPIANLAKVFSDHFTKAKIDEKIPYEKRTLTTGKPNLNVPLARLFFNELSLYPFFLLQRFFYETELGNGYLVLARKNK